MAQTNYTPISLYYSTTASAVPTAANLVPGELAINTNDGKLYYEDSSGVVQVLATKSTGSIGGSNTQVQFNNSGSLGGSSSFTWDGTTVTATKFAGALNGTVGATTASTGAFTTLSATGVATFSAGTVSLPAITTTGDTNTGIYFPAADTIAFTEGGAESMRINSSGNVLIGTATSSGERLRVETATNTYLSIIAGTTSVSQLWFGDTDANVGLIGYDHSTDAMFFRTNNTEAIRIDSSGKVLIGNSTAISTSPRLQVFRSDATVGATSYQLAWFSNATGYGNGIGIYAQDNVCGISADFSGASGGASALAFYTNATTTPLSPSERMRITSAGNVGIGTSSPSYILDIQKTASAQLRLYSTNNSTGSQLILGSSTGASTTSQYIYYDNSLVLSQASVADRLSINSSGIVTMSAYGAGAATFSAAGVISSVSDETWKIKDGVPTNTDAMLQKLDPGYWFYNEEKAPTFGEERQLGFYAQNVHEAIGEEAAPTPQEGKPWGYHDRSVLAIAVMSLKNALNTIEELKQRIETLENK